MNYRISVWIGWQSKSRDLSIRAENALEAIFITLRLLRITTLDNVNGIVITPL